MTQYQRITLKESGEEFVVDAMEYVRAHAGILYLEFIVYDEVFCDDERIWKNQPVKFLTVQPQDILKREREWTEAGEYELITESEKAREMEQTRVDMMRAAAEEDMARRAALITTPDEGEDSEGLFG